MKCVTIYRRGPRLEARSQKQKHHQRGRREMKQKQAEINLGSKGADPRTLDDMDTVEIYPHSWAPQCISGWKP